MKKLLLTLSSILLLSSSLIAKDKQSKTYYKVEVVKSNKKGAFGKTIYKIGDFCFSVVAGAISNSESAKKVITRIEVYFNDKSAKHNDILEEFRGKIHPEIIEAFSTPYLEYKKAQAISFDIELTQKAYLYLVNVSNNDACLIYPNLNDSTPYEVTQGEHTIPSNNSYKIAADGLANEEKFYLITALRPLYFDDFKQKGIFRCTSRTLGIQAIANAQNSQFNDVEILKLNIK